MYVKQHTLQEEVTLEGLGLHTGEFATVTFKPAPEGHGLVFQRVDLPDKPLIPAQLEYVAELARSTTLAVGDAKLHTVEHALAALSGLQLDNVLIEVSGTELPILDGSAKDYTDTLHRGGSVEQKANREFILINEPVHYQNTEKNIDLAALQLNDFRVTVLVDYNSKFLGLQHATMLRFEDFESEIAPSRTFCFFYELESLFKAGLIKGGNTGNAIVIVDKEVSEPEMEKVAKLFNRPDIKVGKQGILNNVELRFPNEIARHKLLDLVGDLALVGSPIKAQILAARPGHASNIAFARQIRKMVQQKQVIRKYQIHENPSVVFDINAIQRILPHRYPFLLVDRITSFEGNTIEGYKNVTINEPFFIGHFDGNPIMPGVLQVEAMAQVGGILLLNFVENPDDHWLYFLAVENARFKKPVVPGDQLVFRIEMEPMKRNIFKIKGKGFVDNVVACEATLVASLVKRNPKQ